MNLASRQPTQTRPTPKAPSRPARVQAPALVEPGRIESMLVRLEEEHTELLALARAHKDALAHASVEQMQQITVKTSEVLMRIAQIEHERRQMTSAEADGQIATLDELLERFGDDDRARIGERRTRLRELILRVKEEQLAVRDASENLANHMRGLIRQVGASLSHSGTYSRAGAVDPGRGQVVSSLDTTR
ncbi:MAG: flagellar protein FlgN [Phycisphaerales bacterium]